MSWHKWPTIIVSSHCAVYLEIMEQVGCTSCAHQAQLGWIRRHSSQEVALPLIHMLRPEKRCESENRSRSGMVSALRLKLENNHLHIRTCISPGISKKNYAGFTGESQSPTKPVFDEWFKLMKDTASFQSSFTRANHYWRKFHQVTV